MESRYFIGALFCGLLLIGGCKEDEKLTESEVTMKVNFNYGSEAVAYNQIFEYDTDKKIKFELIRFYVSRPAFEDEAGLLVASPTEYFLVDLPNPTMEMGKIPVGTYSSVSFGVGVDNSRNIQTDPQAIPATDYPTDHPLNYAQDMYWGWATGYIFAKVEGRIDADNNGSFADANDKAFSYHPGVAELYRNVVVEKTFSFDEKTEQAEITLDLLKLLANVNLIDHPVAHPNTTTHPEYNFAQRMMDNFPTSFE